MPPMIPDRRNPFEPALHGLIGACVALIAAAIAVPLYSDYSKRADAARMLCLAQPWQKAIEANIRRTQSTRGAGAGIDAGPTSFDKFIGDDGVIVLRKDVALVLVPHWSDGKVTWSCMGAPLQDVPEQCRR